MSEWTEQDQADYNAALQRLMADQDARLQERGAYRMEAGRNFVAYLKRGEGDVVTAEVWSWGCRKPDETGATETEVVDRCYHYYDDEPLRETR